MENRNWRLDKTISISDLVILGSMVGTVLFFYYGLDKRIDSQKQSQDMYMQMQRERDTRQDDAVRDTANEIKQQLSEIKQSIKDQTSKLDRFTERGR